MHGHRIEGTVAAIAPAGSRSIDLSLLTHLGGGDIAVDAITGDATQPFFEVMINVSSGEADNLPYDMTGAILLDGGTEPLGNILGRQLLKFLNKLLQKG